MRMDYEGLPEETSLSNIQHAGVMLQQRCCNGKGLQFSIVLSRSPFDQLWFYSVDEHVRCAA